MEIDLDRLEKDVCCSCGCSMSRGYYKKCLGCNCEYLVSEEAFDKAKADDIHNEYKFPNNHPSKFTEELKQKIVEEDETERAQTAREKLAAEHARHPVNADGTLDMSSELNNPLIPDSPLLT